MARPEGRVGVRHRLGRWWINLPLRGKGLVVTTVSTLVLVPPLAVGIYSHQRQQSAIQAVRLSNAAEEHSRDILHLGIDAATGVRGFAASGDEALLVPYRTALDELPETLERLYDTTADDIDEEVDVLAGTATSTLTTFAAVQARAADGPLTGPALDDARHEALAAADALRAEVGNVQELVVARQERQRADVNRYGSWIVWSLVATLAAAVLGGGASSMLLGQGIVGRVRRLTANVDRFVRGEPIVPSRRSYDEIGRLTTHLGNVGDELERRQAALGASRDEALHATQAKDEFLSHMSHELRTPLTAILGFGEILQAEELDEDNRECVDHIVKAGHHLLALINEILDIAKLESGHLTVSLEPVYLAGVVDESLALMQHQAVRSAITVAARVDRDLAVVADQQRLKQVLLNLVSNAVKYNRDGGRVDLAARQAGDRARITVTDTGAGIPPDGLEKLFRPFERLDAAKTGIEGSGVGLALTKGLVEAMQGEIGVDSEVGVGSTFWVELTLATAPPDEVAGLPRRDDQATTGRAGAPELEPVPAPGHGTPEPTPAGTVADAAASPEGPTVLYIEDNPANVRLLESVFQDRPERLEVAVEGQLGIQLARQLEPCLVLLDLHLPDLGGDEVLRALRADPLTADIPVVVISADATPERADQMAADGVTAFLSKPIDAIRLLELVDRLTAVHPG